MKRWIALGILALTLSSCGGSPEAPVAVKPTIAPVPTAAPTAVPTCQILAAGYIKQVEPLVREWDDAATLADNTPRVSLASQIEKLQDIQRRSEALQVPDCAATIQQSFIGQMSATNRAFVAFLGQKPQTTVDDLFAVAHEQQAIFKTEFPHLKADQPIAKSDPPFTDGLKLTRAALQSAYADAKLTFAERPVGGGQTALTGTSADGLITAEFVGPAENVQSAFVSGTMQGSSPARRDAIVQLLRMHLKATMPDWPAGDAWLTTALAANGTQVIANRGRIVRYIRLESGTTSWSLDISVPE
jgi:hypothetical protein